MPDSSAQDGACVARSSVNMLGPIVGAVQLGADAVTLVNFIVEAPGKLQACSKKSAARAYQCCCYSHVRSLQQSALKVEQKQPLLLLVRFSSRSERTYSALMSALLTEPALAQICADEQLSTALLTLNEAALCVCTRFSASSSGRLSKTAFYTHRPTRVGVYSTK
eukprot:16396-Heterococcus_DN1.PRE.5